MGWRLGIDNTSVEIARVPVRVTFLTAVINVEIGSISGRGDQISDGLFITTDKDMLNELLLQQTVEAIGGLEHRWLYNAPAIIYSRKDAPDNFDWSVYLGDCLKQVKMFFNVMWLGKDNAADSELGFLTYPFGLTQMTHSNVISVTYSMANGSRALVSFSRKELQGIRAYFRAWVGEVASPSPYGMLDSDEIRRPMRSFYWIQAGRSASTLGERIACFCTAMESLLATSSAEMAHQLSERMAIFLSDDPAERERTYHQVKRAYSVRSRVVHGDVLRSSKTSELMTVSMECDELLRQAVRKAVGDKDARNALDGGNENLDRYFRNLLFGQEPHERPQDSTP